MVSYRCASRRDGALPIEGFLAAAARHEQAFFRQIPDDGAGIFFIRHCNDQFDIQAGFAPHLPGVTVSKADRMTDPLLLALLFPSHAMRARS